MNKNTAYIIKIIQDFSFSIQSIWHRQQRQQKMLNIFYNDSRFKTICRCNTIFQLSKAVKRWWYNSLWKAHLRAMEHHLPYGITQCYLPPDTDERALP